MQVWGLKEPNNFAAQDINVPSVQNGNDNITADQYICLVHFSLDQFRIIFDDQALSWSHITSGITEIIKIPS